MGKIYREDINYSENVTTTEPGKVTDMRHPDFAVFASEENKRITLTLKGQ